MSSVTVDAPYGGHAGALRVCACRRLSTYIPCGRCRFNADAPRMSQEAKGIVLHDSGLPGYHLTDTSLPLPLPSHDIRINEPCECFGCKMGGSCYLTYQPTPRKYVQGYTLRKGLLIRALHFVFGSRPTP